MSFGRDFSLEEGMSEAVEGGAALAWRLLATLEGGSLLLATSALLAYTVRNKIVQQTRGRRTITNVLVTNTTNLLGRELKRRLEACGCVVETVTEDIDISGAGSGAYSGAISGASSGSKVDAIVVVGAAPKADGLEGMANMVTEDVYKNLRLLESVSPRIHHGGYIAWACARDSDAAPSAFSEAGEAFDTVLRASLQHLAKLRHCEPIWVGRCEGSEQAAERTVTALLTSATQQVSRFSVRNAAHRVGECLGRWLKIVT
ncbi:uncharacterized protein LOC142977035 isoform X2 [Anticarsia gemmatalis]|uniref:uncharacterized protein LOC142977035 isoform X2 n=1 Tax=Anticarsia gemmatalis TaxID=129554 RepID=UPI003F7749DF